MAKHEPRYLVTYKVSDSKDPIEVTYLTENTARNEIDKLIERKNVTDIHLYRSQLFWHEIFSND